MAASDKPDIVVIFTDQWSPRETLPCNTQAKTPHLDAVAQEGMRFTSAYSPSPVCMPARVCLLTGQYPHNTGLWGNTTLFAPPAHQARLFADVKAAGYTTAQIGKLHWTGGPAWKKQQRFEKIGDFYKAIALDYVADVPSPFATPNNRGDYAKFLKRIGKFDAIAADMTARLKGDNYLVKPSLATPEEHNERFVADRAVEFIERQPKDKPMFLVTSFFGPHNPMDAPEPYASMYDPASLQVPPNVKFPYQYDNRPIDEARWRAIKANYLGKMTYIDDCAKLVFDALKKRGKWDNTYIIFVADHGEMMGAHGFMTKGRFYEESAGIPMWIRPPKGERVAGKTSDTPVNLVDIYATIVEAAGGKVSPQRFSHSLLPIVRGERSQVGDGTVFSEIRSGKERSQMVRRGPYKWFYQGKKERLYDLEKDPYELNDLANKPEYAEVQSQLRQAYYDWLYRTQVDYSEGYKPMAQRAREGKLDSKQ